MKEKADSEKTGTWIVRHIPASLMRRTRMAAIAQGKTVRQVLMELVEGHLQELERRGIMPKGKG